MGCRTRFCQGWTEFSPCDSTAVNTQNSEEQEEEKHSLPRPSGRRDVSKRCIKEMIQRCINPESTAGPQNDQPQGEGVKNHLSFLDPQSPLAMEGHNTHTQYCPTLCDPMDCSRPGSSVHGFSGQEYWSRLPFPSPGNLPDPGIEPTSLASPALQVALATVTSFQFSFRGPSFLCHHQSLRFRWTDPFPSFCMWAS